MKKIFVSESLQNSRSNLKFLISSDNDVQPSKNYASLIPGVPFISNSRFYFSDVTTPCFCLIKSFHLQNCSLPIKSFRHLLSRHLMFVVFRFSLCITKFHKRKFQILMQKMKTILKNNKNFLITIITSISAFFYKRNYRHQSLLKQYLN